MSRILLSLVGLLGQTLPDSALPPVRLGDPAFRVGISFDRATFSPDGTLFAVSGGNCVRVLDADTGLLVLDRRFRSEILTVAFTPAGQLVVGERAGWVRFLDPRTGKVFREVSVGVDNAQSVSYSLHGGCRILLIITINGCLGGGRYFDLKAECECPPATAFNLHSGHGGISPDGRLYAEVDWPPATPDRDPNKRSTPMQRLRIHEIDTGKDRVIPLPLARLRSLSFDPTGQTVTVTFLDRIVRIDLQTEVSRTLVPEQFDGLMFAVFSPGGDRFAASGLHRNHPCIREWDANTGRLLSEFPTPNWSYYGLAYTPAGRLLTWNAHGTYLRVGDVHANHWPRFSGHLTALSSVRFLDDGRRLESRDRADHVCTWDISTGHLLVEKQILRPVILTAPEGELNTRLLRRLEISETNPGAPGLVTLDSRVLVTTTNAGLPIHDVRTGTLRQFLHPTLAWHHLTPLAFSPDVRSLLVFSSETDTTEGEVQLRELATGSVRCPWPARSPAAPPRFSPDGRHIAYPRQDGTILLLPIDAPAQPLDPATIWHDLGSRDAAVANVAVQALAARPDARREIAARRTLLDPRAETVDPVALLPALDADDPDTRDTAQRRLRAVSVERVKSVQVSLVGAFPEVRRALRARIEEGDQPPDLSPCDLRRLRVAEVLERIDRRE